jgi:hypothetical protein
MLQDHPDIKFLEKRLVHVVQHEQYEIAAIIKKWIDELKERYSTKN